MDERNSFSRIAISEEISYIKQKFGACVACLKAGAHKKKFGEKMAGGIESEKGHTCIPMEVHTQKARLACVTADSKAGQIVSRAGPAGSMIPEARRGCCAHLTAINVYKAPHLTSDTLMSIAKHSQLAMAIFDDIKITATTIIKCMIMYYRKFYLTLLATPSARRHKPHLKSKISVKKTV